MLRLKLNEIVEEFKDFYGEKTEQMPKILKEGRYPLSSAGLMKRRLDVLTASKEVKNAWWYNDFDTGDAVIYHPDGRFKVVTGKNAEPIWKEINPNKALKRGALILPEGTYDKFDGESFTREEIERYGIAEKQLTMEEAKKNPIWKALAGGDQALLESYVDATFKQDWKQESTMMNIRVLQPSEVTTGNLWCVMGSNYAFCANGKYSLTEIEGRFVGVAPESFSITKPLENSIQTALDKGESFEYKGIVYGPTIINIKA